MPTRTRSRTREFIYLAIVALLVAGPPVALWAGTVSRPVKTCGTTTYVSERAAGCPTIKSSEVDADFAAVIAGVNNIETANVNPSGLGTAAIANLAVTGAKVADTTITASKLAVGASANNFLTTGPTTGLNITTTTETTVATFASMTTRGGRTVIAGSWGLAWQCTNDGTTVIRLRVKRDGSTFYTLDQVVGASGTGATGLFFPLSVPIVSEVASAAPHTYTVTVQATGAVGGCAITSPAANNGTLLAVELS